MTSQPTSAAMKSRPTQKRDLTRFWLAENEVDVIAPPDYQMIEVRQARTLLES